MKNFKMLGGIVFVGTILSSCMSSVGFNVVKPADVDVPKDIETFAVVQRNEAEKGNKLGKAVEGFLSGEGIGTDRRSASHAVTGFVNGVSKSPKFSVKQAHLTEKLYGTGTTQMAAPLSWEKVEEICNANGAQALIVLETFDSDVDRDNSSRTVTRNVNGNKIQELVYTAELRVDVEAGWRMYYPKDKLIVDEHIERGNKRRSRDGNTSTSAYSSLPSSESLIKEEAQEIGGLYAVRISPTHVKVVRTYYPKGSERMKVAKTKVQTKQWEEAINLWFDEYKASGDDKLKGKAAYNLAVGHEAISDFEKAIYWAKEAANLGNKKATRYLRQLEARKADEQRLKEQMK